MRTRNLLGLVAAAPLLIGAMLAPAAAQDYPTKPVELVLPASPGGGIDLFGREVARLLAEQGIVTQPIQVTNTPGAGGSIGIAQVVQRQGDEYTLFGSGLHVYLAPLTLGTPQSYKDLTPIAKLFSEYEVMLVPAESPIKSLKDLETAMKADPGSIRFGGGPLGNTDQITVALFAQAIGVDPAKITYIPYSGGETNAALLGGHIDVGMGGTDVVDMVTSGKMRALAISSKQRLAGGFADTPTFMEQGYDMSFDNWRGIFAPAGVSEAVVKYWQDALTKLVTSDVWKEELTKNQWTDAFETDTFPATLDHEYSLYESLLTQLGLKK